jgi:hypothetical protein
MRTRLAVLLTVALTAVTAACGSTVDQETRDAVARNQRLGVSAQGADDLAAAGDAEDTVNGVTGSGGNATARSAARGTSGASAGVASPGAGGVPAKGRGWDEKYIYIGIPTLNDLSTFGNAGGYRSVETGDVEADARAIVADINAKGGLFGRELRLVFHDTSTATIVSDTDGAVQAACTAFTQDNQVVAVVTPFGNFDTASMRACLAKSGTMLLSSSPAGSNDDKAYEDTAPYYHTFATISFQRLIPTLIRRLAAQQYFSGWDNGQGQPAPQVPAKVGLVYSANPIEERIAKYVERTFKDSGHPIALTVPIREGNPGDNSSAVLNFRSAGVTHVIVMLEAADAVFLNFLVQAESQRFRPRYAVSTPQFLSFHTDNAPHAQLVGSMGVGWMPGLDVLDPQDPGDVGGGQAACRAALAKGGQTFAGDHRFALALALGLCDGIRMVSEGARAGNGLTGAAVRAGLVSIGTKFAAAATFAPTGLSPTSYGLPGAARDIAWDTGCGCFMYKSATYPWAS